VYYTEASLGEEPCEVFCPTCRKCAVTRVEYVQPPNLEQSRRTRGVLTHTVLGVLVCAQTTTGLVALDYLYYVVHMLHAGA
jgi:hypothetical protein